MGLVRRIAWHVHGHVASAIEVEDLTQIGMIALIEAANGYEDRGHAFATYASMRIRGHMIDHLRRHATLHRSAMARRRALNEAAVKFERTHGRSPGESELAAAIGMDPAEFRAMVDSSTPAREELLDEAYSDQSMWFADIADRVDVSIEREQLAETLASHIAALPEREAMVLQLYFVDELNLEEIGEVLGVGGARVCQIKKAGLDRLRTALKDWAN
ncbi:FliA/WhiG family RNA polymerase sigma factor [Sphingomonas sp. MMS24-J13]|uniref:FliA/WhiG family RNA polymerase sigma factor n=1 Tax=Sphingomonas sp. MMS24-J13 TaxID=3238686 RepID=UPI003851648C